MTHVYVLMTPSHLNIQRMVKAHRLHGSSRGGASKHAARMALASASGSVAQRRHVPNVERRTTNFTARAKKTPLRTLFACGQSRLAKPSRGRFLFRRTGNKFSEITRLLGRQVRQRHVFAVGTRLSLRRTRAILFHHGFWVS